MKLNRRNFIAQMFASLGFANICVWRLFKQKPKAQDGRKFRCAKADWEKLTETRIKNASLGKKFDQTSMKLDGYDVYDEAVAVGHDEVNEYFEYASDDIPSVNIDDGDWHHFTMSKKDLGIKAIGDSQMVITDCITIYLDGNSVMNVMLTEEDYEIKEDTFLRYYINNVEFVQFWFRRINANSISKSS